MLGALEWQVAQVLQYARDADEATKAERCRV
jgi:hypothetical protein